MRRRRWQGELPQAGAGLPYVEADGEPLIQAVKRLRTKYKSAILSNSQRDIMQHNLAALGVPLDEVVVAEEVRAYCP
ncbi:MAG TPA: hypothetical protein VKP12_00005, partial [Kiloniellaceae bacterium]|nr:hypothetical protein [Kiloniellaceae bacterium]